MGDSSQYPVPSTCYSGGDFAVKGYFRSSPGPSCSSEELSETFRYRFNSVSGALRVPASPGSLRLLQCLSCLRSHLDDSKHCSSLEHGEPCPCLRLGGR